MDTVDLKPVSSQTILVSLIERDSLFGGSLWQTFSSSSESRNLSPICEVLIDDGTGRMFLRIPEETIIDPSLSLYVHLKYRSLIFRLSPEDYVVLGDRICCQYPGCARVLDERPGGDRYLLPLSADVSLSLKRLERTLKEFTHEIELRVVDVSELGFGIIISAQNKRYFREQDHFWLRAVDHRELRTPILGKVCYVAPRGHCLRRGDVRVGLSLSSPLQKEVLENLKRRCLLVLAA